MRRRDLMTVLVSAMVGRPLAARAQQKAMPVIGWLSGVSPTIQGGSHMPEVGTYDSLPVATWTSLAAFAKGLSETGYIEGQNVAIECRWAEGHFDRLPAFAADLVAQKVDVIVAAAGTASALAAKGATSTIPIVFASVGDPVETGLVASFARRERDRRRFRLLGRTACRRARGWQQSVLHPPNRTASGIVSTLRRSDELSFPWVRHGRWPDQLRSPRQDLYRGAGVYVGRILAGAKPADLPVQQPTKFSLVINLKTAKALGLTVPPGMLDLADEVIE